MKAGRTKRNIDEGTKVRVGEWVELKEERAHREHVRKQAEECTGGNACRGGSASDVVG